LQPPLFARSTKMSQNASFSQADPLKRQCAEHRRWARTPSQPGVHALVVIGEKDDRLRAEVRNISPGGAGLVLARELEPGRAVLMDLHNQANGFRCQVSARVVYTADLSTGDVLHGCMFTRELSALEVRGLLA
jgi:PilZ domain